MIIKLNSAISISRHREERIEKKLTRADRIKLDRVVMAILFILTIVISAFLA